jgi:hydrogenase/urease accessory protein HupE
MLLRALAKTPPACRAAVLWLLLAPPVRAHDPGLSTADIRINPGQIEAHLTFARADVDTLLPLDADADGAVSAAEFAAARGRLEEMARGAMSFRADGRELTPAPPAVSLDETNNIHFTLAVAVRGPRELSLHSALIDRLPRGHRQFVVLLDREGQTLAEVLLSAEQDVMEVDVSALLPPAAPFRQFLWLGVEHIWTGYDHLLFLFALLIVVSGFRPAAVIITCFTVAHSVTLGLATLDVVNLPSRWVEPFIAATIIYVGAENLIRREGPRGRWLLTFGFGLVHGFGFAGVLRELGVSSGTTGIAVPLLAFNLGVELGQLAVAAVALPVIWWLRARPGFVRHGVPACSALVVAAGVYWLVQRVFF